MSKILFALTVVLFVGYHYSDALPALSLSNMPFNSGDPIPFVDPKCNAAIQEAGQKCNQTTEAKWHNVYVEMIKAEEEGDKAKYEHLKVELGCCETWDAIPCVEAGMKDGCSTEDYQKVWIILEWAKQQLEVQYCQDYPFAERADKCKPF